MCVCVQAGVLGSTEDDDNISGVVKSKFTICNELSLEGQFPYIVIFVVYHMAENIG